MIEIRQLRYFSVLASYLNFTAAAEALHISQPHLSREIRQLEDQLGVPLLTRTSRQVALTEAGRVFLRQIRSVLGGLDEAVASAEAIYRGERGILRVAFVGSITYSWLPILVRAYRDKYPAVQISIRSEMMTGAQVQALLLNEIDVGLLRPPIDAPELVAKTVYEEALIVALPSTHALCARDEIPLELLSEDSFITYSSTLGSNTRKAVIAACLDCDFHPRILQTVGETHTLVSLVSAGMGVALVPASTEHLKISGVMYRPLSLPRRALRLAMAWRRADKDVSLLKNFTEVVEEVAEVL